MKKLLLFFTLLVAALPAQEALPGKCSKYVISRAGGVIEKRSKKFPEVKLSGYSRTKVGAEGELCSLEKNATDSLHPTWRPFARVKVVSITDYVHVRFQVLERFPDTTGTGDDPYAAGRQIGFAGYRYARVETSIERWPNGSLKWNGQKRCDREIGEWTFYDENGGIQYHCRYDSNGVKQGPFEEYHSNGQLKMRGTFADGKWTGESWSWHPNGVHESHEIRKDGAAIDTNWHPNGRIEKIYSCTAFKNGNPQNAFYREYYDNGQLKEEWQTDSLGRRNGVHVLYYESGILNAITTYDHGKKDGPYMLVHKNGIVIDSGGFKNGQKEGVWRLRWGDIDKVSMEFHYTAGQTNGTVTVWRPDGTIERTGEWNMGCLYGTWKSYDEAGTLRMLIVYDRETERGACTEYDWDGNRTGEGGYYDLKRNGTWTLYYPNGKLQARGNYVKGKESGEWTYWDEEGEESRQVY